MLVKRQTYIIYYYRVINYNSFNGQGFRYFAIGPGDNFRYVPGWSCLDIHLQNCVTDFRLEQSQNRCQYNRLIQYVRYRTCVVFDVTNSRRKSIIIPDHFKKQSLYISQVEYLFIITSTRLWTHVCMISKSYAVDLIYYHSAPRFYGHTWQTNINPVNSI